MFAFLIVAFEVDTVSTIPGYVYYSLARTVRMIHDMELLRPCASEVEMLKTCFFAREIFHEIFQYFLQFLLKFFKLFSYCTHLHSQTLRKNKSSMMVADTNPIVESTVAETWIGKIGCRRAKLTIVLYPFTVTKVTNVGTRDASVNYFI